MSLTVVVPALNEEANLESAVVDIVAALRQCVDDWQIVVVNDGSTDRTGDIATELAHSEPRIMVLHHERPLGVGFSFRDGVRASSKDAITWLPGDDENDARELLKYLPLLEHVDMVIPFVLNIGVRSWGRRFLSTLYLWVINVAFGTMFNYTNGNVIYRREVFQVVSPQASGFFFQAECLIKAIRAGFIFAEVPVRQRKRRGGRSKALSPKSFYAVVRDFLKLFVAVHIQRVAGRVPRRLQYPTDGEVDG